MEPGILIFVLGSLLSFYPFYRLLDRRRLERAARARRTRGLALPDTPRQRFLDSLRREAAARAERTVKDVASRIRRASAAGSAEALDAQTMLRLDETDSMLRQLLPADVVLAFSRVAAALRTATPASIGHLDELIRQFESALATATSPPVDEQSLPARALLAWCSALPAYQSLLRAPH